MPDSPANRAVARTSVIVAIVAVAAALYLGSDFFVPVALALLLSALLWPVVERLTHWRIPTAGGAAIVIIGCIALLVAAIASFEPPLQKFANGIPASIAAARPRLLQWSSNVRRLTGSAAETDSSATPRPDSARQQAPDSGARKSADTATRRRGTDSAKGEPPDDTALPRVEPGAGSGALTAGVPAGAAQSVTHALGIAASLVGSFVEVMLLALFILAAGNAWRRKVTTAEPTPARVKSVIDTVCEMRHVVSRYVLASVAINVAQATLVAIGLKLLGYPSALLWGVLTFALEFIPYLGGLVLVGLLLATGLAAGRGFPSALAGPALYLVITTLQNNVLSPIVYGRGMRLNPTAILLSTMLWFMLWGVAGAFLAVPMLAAFNVLAARVPALRTVNVFLSE